MDQPTISLEPLALRAQEARRHADDLERAAAEARARAEAYEDALRLLTEQLRPAEEPA